MVVSFRTNHCGEMRERKAWGQGPGGATDPLQAAQFWDPEGPREAQGKGDAAQTLAEGLGHVV